jgi:uncharacterized protein (DUF2147 family)
MKSVLVSIAFALSVLGLSAQAQAASAEGFWLLSSGKLTVKVSNCDGDKICGTISGLAQPLQQDGGPKLDFKNPDRSLRSRHVIGLPVFTGMVPTGENRWKGTIYNADDGGTYRAYATLNGDKFEVKGCWGPFCKDLNFSRVK